MRFSSSTVLCKKTQKNGDDHGLEGTLKRSQNHSGNRLAQPRRPGGTRPQRFARVVRRGPSSEDYSLYETDGTGAVISRKRGAPENTGLVCPIRLSILPKVSRKLSTDRIPITGVLSETKLHFPESQFFFRAARR